MSAATRTGRSRSVTLPSARTVWRTARDRRRVGEQQHRQVRPRRLARQAAPR
jgi:hypothetical protein